MSNGQVVASATASALTVAVKTLAGAILGWFFGGVPDPNATGTYDAISVTNALSLTVPSTANCWRGQWHRVSFVAGRVQQWRQHCARHRPHIVGAFVKRHCAARRQRGRAQLGLAQHRERCQRHDVFESGRNPQGDARARLYRMEFARPRRSRHMDGDEPALRGTDGTGVRLPGQVVQSIFVLDQSSPTTTGTTQVNGILDSGFACYDACH